MATRTTLGFPDDDWRKLRKALLVVGGLAAVGVIPSKYGKSAGLAVAIIGFILP